MTAVISRAALGAVIALTVALSLVAASSAGRKSPATKRTIWFERGVTVGEWGPTAYAEGQTKDTLARLAKDQHVRSVTLFLNWMQADGSATTIAPGSETPSTQRVVQAIRAAKKLRLEVILRPYVEIADGSWRGDIHPSSVGAWFRSYDDFILRFAAIAQTEHVDGLVIGTEMKSMSPDARSWRSLVRHVRARFKGFVTYEANFDEYAAVTWWDALDVIDISAYFPLAKTATYSLSDLVAAWAPWKQQVSAVQRHFKLPVVFGELGYRAVTGAAQRPWDILLSGPPDPGDQARAYEAAFRAWYHVRWFRGFQWWYVAPQPDLVEGFTGADQRPAAEALAVLRHWYAISP
jgi:hypothetical protein